MNIIGHGVYIANVRCIKGLVEQRGECFEWQCLTAVERHASGFRTNRIQYLASRLAAKKAVLKAIGGDCKQLTSWHEIEIQHLPTGKPIVVLYANCQEIAAKLGITKWLLSISHTPSYAAASAIALQAVVKPIALCTEFREKLDNQTIERQIAIQQGEETSVLVINLGWTEKERSLFHQKLESLNFWNALEEQLANPQVEVVGHSLDFEQRWMLAKYGYPTKLTI